MRRWMSPRLGRSAGSVAVFAGDEIALPEGACQPGVLALDRGRSIGAAGTAAPLGRSRGILLNPDVDGPAVPRSERGV